jgi:hypothetical protein
MPGLYDPDDYDSQMRARDIRFRAALAKWHGRGVAVIPGSTFWNKLWTATR